MKKALKQMVEECLRNIPETRNSDIVLAIAIWRRYFPQRIRKGASGEEGVWLRDLIDLPREDNVKRIRAKFNAEGKYYPLTGKWRKPEALRRTTGAWNSATLQRQRPYTRPRPTVIWTSNGHSQSLNYSTIKR